jgi:hypothetical protein
VRASRAVLGGVLTLAAVVTACSALSHVSALKPPSITAAKVRRLLPSGFREIPAPARQLGIGIDFYTYPGQNIETEAKLTIAYIKTLHANSVSISFPFFMHGRTTSAIYSESPTTNARTPSPAQLALVAGLAERAGLYVSIRPLLDENSLGAPRTNWQPANPPAWFASYKEFMLPYAEMAQEADIPEFVEGTEFSYFGNSPLWNGVATALRTVYTGTLVYDNNYGLQMRGNGGAGVVEAVDAYQPQEFPPSASQAQLTAGWVAYDRTLPRGTVELEVDIAAVSGAYRRPFQVSGWNETQLDPAIQVNWFTGACDAAAETNLGGLYYWAVDIGQSLTTPPGLTSAASWVDGPGAVVVSDCFATLGSSG